MRGLYKHLRLWFARVQTLIKGHSKGKAVLHSFVGPNYSVNVLLKQHLNFFTKLPQMYGHVSL